MRWRQMVVLTMVLTIFIVAIPYGADACTFTFDTYYSVDTYSPEDSTQCDWSTGPGLPICHIELRGIRYQAAGPNPPVLIWNHGSGEPVFAGTRGPNCAIANYFVALGYTVYVPLRRGHYAPAGSRVIRSTGAHWSDVSESSIDYLWRQRRDVELAVQHVETFNGHLPTRIAIMGNSYGGMVTLFANTIATLGHRAVVAFSPGGISWSRDSDQSQDGNGDGVDDNENDVANTNARNVLKFAVRMGTTPPFFLQAKGDWDTRPTSVLSKVAAESAAEGADHGREFQASIFAFGVLTDDGLPDPQATHEDFPRQTALWGPSVLAFLTRFGVAP